MTGLSADASTLGRFAREADRGVLADSYLFVGPSRRRLRRTALACAARVLEHEGDVEQHPDCLVFDPEELGVRGLRVEHIAARKEGVASLEEGLRYKPVQGGRRVAVLLAADRMGPDAQAALLKTSEEPPPGTLLLLTAGDLSALLPALRSRCRSYRVASPPAEELARLAAAAEIVPEDWATLCAGLGSGESALDLTADDREALLALHRAFQAWVAGASGPAGWLALPEGTLAQQREQGGLALSACLGWLARAYRSAPPEGALRLDRAAAELVAGIADLRGQISPGVVFEALQFRLDQELTTA